MYLYKHASLSKIFVSVIHYLRFPRYIYTPFDIIYNSHASKIYNHNNAKMSSDKLLYKVVSLDGNIGAGKTSILKELEKRGYVVFPEDITTWKPMLNAFYNNPQRWSFTLQMTILNSLCNQYEQMKRVTSGNAIIFMERAPASSYIFAEICKEDGFMTNDEFKIYQGIFEKLIWKPNIKLFIDTDVMPCMARIAKRAREYEKEIKPAYLEKLVMGYAKCSFDGYLSGVEEISKIVDRIIEMVNDKSQHNN